MAQTITDDDLDELELSGRGDDHSRHVATTAIAWAEDPARLALEEPLTPAHLLLVASDHLEMLGELDEAWVVANRAAEHPTAEPFEALSTLVSIRLAQHDLAAAAELLDGYRRAGAITADLAAQLADVIESSPIVEDEAGAMTSSTPLTEEWCWNTCCRRAGDSIRGQPILEQAVHQLPQLARLLIPDPPDRAHDERRARREELVRACIAHAL